jgi:hypothetical protein
MGGAEQGVGGPGLIDERAQVAEQHLDARQRELAAMASVASGVVGTTVKVSAARIRNSGLSRYMSQYVQ